MRCSDVETCYNRHMTANNPRECRRLRGILVQRIAIPFACQIILITVSGSYCSTLVFSLFICLCYLIVSVNTDPPKQLMLVSHISEWTNVVFPRQCLQRLERGGQKIAKSASTPGILLFAPGLLRNDNILLYFPYNTSCLSYMSYFFQKNFALLRFPHFFSSDPDYD